AARACRRCRPLSPAHAIAEAFQLGGDALGMVALNLDLAVLCRSARAALLLQRRPERGERLRRQLEAAGDGDELSGAALAVEDYADGLLRRVDIAARLDRPFLAKAFRFLGIAGPDQSGFHRAHDDRLKVFACGFAVQQLLELADPVLSVIK